MTKLKFLLALNEKLTAYPQAEVEERLGFYSEMIEDRMEEGLTEEEAVAAVGSVEEIAEQIAAELSPEKTEQGMKKPEQKQKLKAWEIVLLVLGMPVWLSLLVAFFAVMLSLYAALWSVVISLWAVFGALVGCAVAGIVGGIGFWLTGYGIPGMALLAAGLVCGGLSVFFFFGCKAATRGMVLLTKKVIRAFSEHECEKEEAK